MENSELGDSSEDDGEATAEVASSTPDVQIRSYSKSTICVNGQCETRTCINGKCETTKN